MRNSLLVMLALLLMAQIALAGQKRPDVSGKLVVFHAGSLAVPFREIAGAFMKEYPNVKVLLEAAGSRTCARKVSDLKRPCDVMASADYTVINALLIPEHADWNIKFAANEMTIVYHQSSRASERINQDNWFEVLMEKDVRFGRSDPSADPCGYRAVMTMKLAETIPRMIPTVGATSPSNEKFLMKYSSPITMKAATPPSSRPRRWCQICVKANASVSMYPTEALKMMRSNLAMNVATVLFSLPFRPAGNRRAQRMALIVLLMSRLSLGSASAATFSIISMFAGLRASGRHSSVMQLIPSTRSPACAATITSGTVDMPTASAPIVLRNRYSALVSRLGPATPT